MGRRTVLAVAGWLAAAVAATAIGVGALRLIGDGITSAGAEVLTPEQVASQLAVTGPAAAPSPSGSPGDEPGPATDPRSFSGPGGVVVAVCHADGRSSLRSWTPAQGYQVERVRRGPDEHAEVRFQGSAGRSQVRIRCAGGEPSAEWSD